MNDIVLFRQMIDACCYLVGYLDRLSLDDRAREQASDVLSTICSFADKCHRDAIERVFNPSQAK